MKIDVVSKNLDFNFEAGTSRGRLTQKKVYFLVSQVGALKAIGEVAPLPKLSLDDVDNLEEILQGYVRAFMVVDSPSEALSQITQVVSSEYPAIRFGFETLFLDLIEGGKQELFQSKFSREQAPIPINGLVWMGSKEFMLDQIDQKLAKGFTCLKMKIGAIDFDQECALLSYIRNHFGPDRLVLRVDANGAFGKEDAQLKLEQLSEFELHSIEQPVKAGQWEFMRKVCETSPVPVALDEELIGVHTTAQREGLLETTRPAYIILKPTLVGGFASCDEWISIAEKRGIGWWMTSALESNVGLNAIAQYTATKGAQGHQGLGTGQLFSNNIPSPLTIQGEHLFYDRSKSWDFSGIIR